MVRFRKNYFLLAVLLFLIEVLIALFLQDKFIRPYVGDFLVVILLYCTLKAFFEIKVFPAAVFVLLFAFMIEFLQFVNILDVLGLERNSLTAVVFGFHFEWADMLAYTIGISMVIVIERMFANEDIFLTCK